MKKRARSQADKDDEQFERFKAAARELGCDMSEEPFGEMVRTIAKAPPTATTKPPPRRKGG